MFVFVANSEGCETEGPGGLFESLFWICDAAAANRKIFSRQRTFLISRLKFEHTVLQFCKFSVFNHRAEHVAVAIQLFFGGSGNRKTKYSNIFFNPCKVTDSRNTTT